MTGSEGLLCPLGTGISFLGGKAAGTWSCSPAYSARL